MLPGMPQDEVHESLGLRARVLRAFRHSVIGRFCIGLQRVRTMPPPPALLKPLLEEFVRPVIFARSFGTGRMAVLRLMRALPRIGDALWEVQIAQAFLVHFVASAKMLVLLVSSMHAARTRRRLGARRRLVAEQLAARRVIKHARRFLGRSRAHTHHPVQPHCRSLPHPARHESESGCPAWRRLVAQSQRTASSDNGHKNGWGVRRASCRLSRHLAAGRRNRFHEGRHGVTHAAFNIRALTARRASRVHPISMNVHALMRMESAHLHDECMMNVCVHRCACGPVHVAWHVACACACADMVVHGMIPPY